MTHDPRVLNETIQKLMDIEGMLLVRAASELLDAITPIIVAAEREACAKDCDKIAGNTADFDRWTRRAAGMCAAAIRARKP